MAQFFLEAFQCHGGKRGDAFTFYAGDIRVEGPYPFCSRQISALFLTFPTRRLTGQQVVSSAGWGASRAFRHAGSAGSSPNHSDRTSGLRTTGIRLWSSVHSWGVIAATMSSTHALSVLTVSSSARSSVSLMLQDRMT